MFADNRIPEMSLVNVDERAEQVTIAAHVPYPRGDLDLMPALTERLCREYPDTVRIDIRFPYRGEHDARVYWCR
jgi:hypothetical protein